MKKKRFLAVLLAAAMVFSMAACGGKSSSDSSSDKKADKEASTEEEILDNEITGDASKKDAFVIWAWNTDFVTLEDLLTAKYPDLMLLEVGYVQKYVQSDYLTSLSDLGITADDTKDQFKYNIELGSDKDGTQKASFWQATPGCIQIRADLVLCTVKQIWSDHVNASKYGSSITVNRYYDE